MLFGRLSDILHTLRFRLAAWVTIVVVLLVTITLFAVREVVRRTLLHEFDQRLRQDLVEVRLSLKEYLPDKQKFYQAMMRKTQGHLHVSWFVQLLNDRGDVVWATLSAPQTDKVPRNAPEMTLLDEASNRLIQASLDEPDQPKLLIRVGSSRQSVEDDIALLNRIMVLAGVSIFILAPLGGYLLAGRATRPIAKIISTTARLQPKNLDERLPLRGTGDELDQLSRTINSMLDRIAAYLESNRDFIANAAHELRSPLAAIRSSVDVALDRSRSPEEYATLLTDVAEECGRLTNLLNRLLLLAEGDAGRMALHVQEVRLDKIVRESVDMFEAFAESQGIALKLSGLSGLVVRGDESYLRQVVRNLLDNAIKFTPPPGRILIDLSADRDKQRATLNITDSGIGISAEELPRIFERFYRVDRARSRHGGSTGNGLGLAICQAIVSALEGSIRVESRLGQGSTFSVELPLVNTTDDVHEKDQGRNEQVRG